MRRLSLSLIAGLIVIAPILSATPASAASLSMGCNIQPSSNDNFTTACTTIYAVSSYTVGYYVQGGTGTYTYSWTPPVDRTILAGCTSTSASCVISTGAQRDQILTASVVVTQGSSQTDFSATAFIPGNGGCGSKQC